MIKHFTALALILALSLWGSFAAGAEDDPCAGEELTEDEIGLNYRGHCVAFDREGPPVQCLYVSKTEDAWGAVTALGILLVRGPDGEAVIEPAPFLALDAAEIDLAGECLIVLGGD